MQATLDATGLKHLTRALICLSKFGEDVIFAASPDTFVISSTNPAMAAYGCFKYPRSFFSKYHTDPAQVNESLSGQVANKILLSIFKHRTSEKSCEKCELVITDGPSQESPVDNEEEHDTLESRLTVRLHCKHGVVKTHRLSLNHTTPLSPTLPDPVLESRLVVGPKVLKNLLEHFPFSKGGKSDPQLMWNFWEDEVQLRSLETSVEAKDKPQLVTELTISAEEFEQYDLEAGPMTITFHLREFNSTIAYAEASQGSLTIRFTDPAQPVLISVDNELSDSLFLIATSHVQLSQRSSQDRKLGDRANGNAGSNGKKRPLEDDSNYRSVPARPRIDRTKKPMQVVHRTDNASIAREMRPPPTPSQAPPSWAILTAAQKQGQQPSQSNSYQHHDPDYDQDQFPSAGPSQPEVGRLRAKEPLFLPSSQLSQLPPAAEAAIIESGLGIEDMTAEEFEAMLEGDAEEVEFGNDRVGGHGDRPAEPDYDAFGGDGWNAEDRIDFAQDEGRDSFELVDDIEMEPTQHGSDFKPFRPLFED
ncbi:Rad9-domain-containing protein [Daedaleopsis nitida]|nr:Rad9-domain-containing protein [Daedaleopsis nitida]